MCNSCDHSCHSHTLTHELVVHLPYAIFSVAFAMAVLSFVSFYTMGVAEPESMRTGYKALFHCFHFMHLVFAATGTILTFSRFSSDLVSKILVGIFSPMIFCMTSDAIFPYLGGELLGIHMKLHLCFITDIWNVVPFLFVGIVNGFIMSRHRASLLPMYSIFSHMAHILVSSLASIFYLVSYGFTAWYECIGFVFLFLIVAVVLPCTLSDLVVPILFARANNEHKKH